jgi:hypothetical protein
MQTSYWCQHCGIASDYPELKYRIEIEVKDETGNTTFVILDDEAHKIIRIPVKQLRDNTSEKVIYILI